MRASPAGWFFDSLEDTVTEARWSAEVTHNHPEGIRGAECVAVCIVQARQRCSCRGGRALVEERFYSLQRTLDGLRPGYSFDLSCTGTVPVTVLAVRESGDFESAVRLDGDSDTLACIVGSIAEAFYGDVREALAERAKLYLTPAMLGVVEVFEAKVRRPG